MNTIRQGPRIWIDTPAKINLFLELCDRRADGYHELETLMVPIGVYDRLMLEPLAGGGLEVQCNWVDGYDVAESGELPNEQHNLAYRSLALLRERAGISDGARMWLWKRIPSQAGLGGASSDAAAALVAGSRLWGIDWSRARLAELASELGSDVPFFLFGGVARCTGRGEIIDPIATRGQLSVVVVKPKLGLATRSVFACSDVPQHPKAADSLISSIRVMDAREVGRHLFNRLQMAASKLTPWIREIASVFQNLGVCGHQMSGSGTSYFAVCHNRRHARQVAKRLSSTGLGRIFVATTIGLDPT